MTVLAVDLGGTHLRLAIVDDDGVVSRHRRVDTPAEPDPAGLAALAREVGAAEVASAVAGVPGRVDYATGCVERAPNLSKAWRSLLTESALAELLGMPVALANDADLAAVGEAWFGAGRDHADVAYLTLSTGVGAGLVSGGLLVHARRSMAEIGHTIIDIGAASAGLPSTVEELGSGTALESIAAQLGLTASGQEVVERAAAGDRVASAVLHDVLRAAAVAAVNLAHLFTPDVLVLGGGLGLNGAVVLDPIRSLLASHGPQDLPRPIEVAAAALGDEAGLAGAGAWGRAVPMEVVP